jgi:predicted transcriptional regulator
MANEFKRSKLQMCFNVLEVIGRGISKPTRIMYSANLSWNTLLEVFILLTSQDLIKEIKIGDSKRYTLTEKGREALIHYKKALASFEDENNSRTRLFQG